MLCESSSALSVINYYCLSQAVLYVWSTIIVWVKQCIICDKLLLIESSSTLSVINYCCVHEAAGGVLLIFAFSLSVHMKSGQVFCTQHSIRARCRFEINNTPTFSLLSLIDSIVHFLLELQNLGLGNLKRYWLSKRKTIKAVLTKWKHTLYWACESESEIKEGLDWVLWLHRGKSRHEEWNVFIGHCGSVADAIWQK